MIERSRPRRRASGRAARPDERGAVAVEMALVTFFILAPLLLGIVTTGLSYSRAIAMTNAVREGSRFASITPYPPAAGVWQDDVITRTRLYQADNLGAGSTRICVDLYKQGATSPRLVDRACNGGPSGLSGGASDPAQFTAPAGTPTGGCVVRVTALRYFTINAVLFQVKDRVMSRQSISVYERATCG